jgi:hypothetical protein
MVAKTFLYIIIILSCVNKLNSSMSNFGGRVSQSKKIKLFLGISFFLPTYFNRIIVQLVAKKTGTVRIKLTHFYNFSIV